MLPHSWIRFLAGARSDGERGPVSMEDARAYQIGSTSRDNPDYHVLIQAGGQPGREWVLQLI